MSVKEQNNSNDNIKEHPKPWNLLADHHGIKIDQKLILKLTKEATNVTNDDIKNCMVLHLTSEWNFEKLLALFNGFNTQECPNFFVVIIEGSNLEFLVENSEKSEKIKESILKFGAEHPLILQLTSKDENMSKVYYKEVNSGQFLNISQQEENVAEIKDFSSLLRSFLDSKIKNVEQITAAWQNIIKSSISMKFLKLFENLFFKLILEVTKSGTKEDLLTVLDAPAEHKGRVLSFEAQNYLSELIPDSLPGKKSSDQANDEQVSSNNVSSNESDNNQALMDESATSVLLTAVEHKNIEVIDYLITYWTHLIQELPANHQMQISTTAFKSNQFDVLCDLLDIVDFPFPEDFEFDDELEHKRLRRITLERMAFTNAIKKENFEKIDKFIDDNRNLKCVYSIDNETALAKAIDLKKFGVFYYLKSLGFQGEDCEDLLNQLDKEDRKIATQQAVKQRKANVNQALVNVHKSVMLLATRSLIHNRRISKQQEAEYRQKIINWLQDIQKVAPEMLDVAASCEYLKIIFDFESLTVENASLAGPNSLGSAYSVSKWIFVGAELSDKKREQQIKGVLAHELCHYVMRLVYENEENPYYKDRDDIKEMYERIVRAIDIWSTEEEEEEAEHQDDECNGTISSVFTLYKPEDSHPELIVRVVQILTEFDDDEENTRHLQEKYQNLFSFWHNQVIPELQLYLQKFNEVYKLNEKVGLLSKIQHQRIELCVSKNGIQNLIANKIAIVSTNFPPIFFVDVHNYLKIKYEYSLEIQNLFLYEGVFSNVKYLDNYRVICMEQESLNVFIDCTKSLPESLDKYLNDSNYNFIFIVSNKDQSTKLAEICTQSPFICEFEYNWNDLNETTQNNLLQSEIKFQNNLVPLCQLLSKDQDLSAIISERFLNFLLEGRAISINAGINLTAEDKKFNVLFRDRNLKKYTKASDEMDEDEENDSNQGTKLTQKQMLQDVANNHYVLVSDMAGTGKSWLLRNMARQYQNNYIFKWTSFIDLKQFKEAFSRQPLQPEFSNFMIEKILKLKDEIEIIIFKELYKNGNIVMFFDGFDEISQQYAEIVKQLIKAFSYNGGNQMWISTRQQFEVNLQTYLNLNTTFGFDIFTINDGRNLMAYSWIIWEIEVDIDEHTDLESIVKNSPNLSIYLDYAQKLIADSRDNLRKSKVVGTPAIYEAMAKFFKDKKVLNDGKNMSDYYNEFETLLVKRSRTIKTQ